MGGRLGKKPSKTVACLFLSCINFSVSFSFRLHHASNSSTPATSLTNISDWPDLGSAGFISVTSTKYSILSPTRMFFKGPIWKSNLLEFCPVENVAENSQKALRGSKDRRHIQPQHTYLQHAHQHTMGAATHLSTSSGFWPDLITHQADRHQIQGGHFQ